MIDVGSITINEIVTALAVIVALVTYLRSATEPIKKFNQRVESIEQHQANDLKRIDDITDCLHLLLRSNIALLAHSEDNNHTGELKAMEKEINDYLVNLSGGKK